MRRIVPLLFVIALAATAVLSARDRAQATGPDTWTDVPPLTFPRDYGGVPTLLDNGRVLVTGGVNVAGSPVSQPEVFDPASNMWSLAGSVIEPLRYFHAATRLSDGRVLVTGGDDGSNSYPSTPFASAEIYDPLTNTWAAAAPMHRGRARHKAVLLPNGNVLVLAGAGGPPPAPHEVYDLASNSWTDTPSLGQLDFWASGVVTLQDGRVLVVAGGYQPQTFLYDYGTNTWAAGGATHVMRGESTSLTLLPSGKVLLAGGGAATGADTRKSELFDPRTNTWSTVASMAGEPSLEWAALLGNGLVLITHRTSAEVYNPDLDAYSTVAPPPHTWYYGTTGTSLSDGRVFVIGSTNALVVASIYEAGPIPPPNTATPGPTMTPVPPTAIPSPTPNGSETATPTVTSSPTPTSSPVATNTLFPQPTSDTPLPTSTPNAPTPTSTPCAAGDSDFDGFADCPPTKHEGPSNTDVQVDNCLTAANPLQTNTDGDFVDSSPPKAFDDITWPNSDALGDACDADADNDGIPNVAETGGPPCASASAATNPLLRDTDGDRALDGAECALGYDPASAASTPPLAPAGDTDHDGLPDAFEGTIGTNPLIVDTDGDKINDGVEYVFYNSDPLSTNTDGDACGDGKETGSVNDDTKVNSTDQLLVAQSFTPMHTYYVFYDINKDGKVNSTDLLIQAKVYGASCP